MEWDKAMVAELAQEQGVCVRPLARRLVDRVSGEASTVVLPCGSTRESRCPVCARRARVLRMHQCAEGWHSADELSDDDLEHMHRVRGSVNRHLRQRPDKEEIETSRWRTRS